MRCVARLPSEVTGPGDPGHEESAAATPSDHLCGLIVLAPVATAPIAFSSDAFRTFGPRGRPWNGRQRGGAALLTVSRLDGRSASRGLAREVSPAAGALAGMAKTAGHEWLESIARRSISTTASTRRRRPRADRRGAVATRAGRSRPDAEGRRLELEPVARTPG